MCGSHSRDPVRLLELSHRVPLTVLELQAATQPVHGLQNPAVRVANAKLQQVAPRCVKSQCAVAWEKLVALIRIPDHWTLRVTLSHWGTYQEFSHPCGTSAVPQRRLPLFYLAMGLSTVPQTVPERCIGLQCLGHLAFGVTEQLAACACCCEAFCHAQRVRRLFGVSHRDGFRSP